MAKMSNLPVELAEEILCRVPLTSTRRIRSTCKKWNTLSKDGIFTRKHLAQAAATRREGEFSAIVVLNYKVSLMSVNLRGIGNNSDPYLKPTGKLISLDESDQVDIARVFHCEGLVLCTTVDHTRLVVWNPYTGQTRRICVQPRSVDHTGFSYAQVLGYEKSKSGDLSHKILRFDHHGGRSVYEIYELNSDSWRVLDVTPDWDIEFDHHGLSLKGNSYWYARDKISREDFPDFLICFDFTAESFGPRLPLPFPSFFEDSVILSSARDEQLAVLWQHCDTYEMEVWVTTKIEPDAVSWSKFLEVDDMKPFTDFWFLTSGSFFIDEDRRAVVIIDYDECRMSSTRLVAYIVGENGYYGEVDLGKEIKTDSIGHPLACSYLPSSVPFNQPE